MCATYCVLKANLAHPIALFDEAAELAKYGVIDAVDLRESLQSNDQKEMLDKMRSSGASAFTQRSFFDKKADMNGAIYERMVILIPYKAPDMVKQIRISFEQINIKMLNLESATYLNTKELTSVERDDRSFDFLGGF